MRVQMRIGSVLVIAAIALLAMPLSAYAATGQVPPLAPASIQATVTFESASQLGTDTAAGQLNAYPYNTITQPATSWWGRITQRHQSGSYGLWCAGSGSASWPFYQPYTKGFADYLVEDTSQYYQSWVQYTYIMPSLDTYDIDYAFNVNWYDSPHASTSLTPDRRFTPAQTPLWTTVRLARAGAGPALPASAGYLQFGFMTSASSSGNGEGPTIDDLVVNGWMYGPANNVTAVRGSNPASVTVTWAPPYSHPDTTTLESRPISYRVWRHDVTTDTWTELTSSTSRVTGTSITDSNADLADTDQYFVQAWDQGTGPNFGQGATSAKLVPANGTQMTSSFVSVGGDSALLAYGSQTKIAGALVNGAGGGVTGQAGNVVVQSSPDGSTWTTSTISVAESSTLPGTYVATVPQLSPAPDSVTYYRFQFNGGGGWSGSASAPALQLSLRPASTAWSAAAAASSTVEFGASTSVSAHLNLNEPGMTGAVTGQATVIKVQASSNGSVWTDTTFPVSEGPSGVYSATVSNITSATPYFRFHLPSGTSAYAESVSDHVTIATRAANVSWSSITQTPIVGGNPTVPYLGSITIAGTLGNNNGVATGEAANIVAQYSTDNGGTWTTSTATVTEVADGRYSANVQILAHTYDTVKWRVRLYFAGDGNFTPSFTPGPPAVLVIQVAKSDTKWQVPPAPIVVASGGSATVGADLVGTLTGVPVSGDRNGVTLWRSVDNATWSNTGALATESPSGHYYVTIPNVTSHYYYQWRYTPSPATSYASDYAVSPNSASIEVTVAASPDTNLNDAFSGTGATSLTLPINAQQVIYGALTDSGSAPIAGQATNVVVQTSPDGASSWTTATAPAASATVESSTAGTYQVTVAAPASPSVTTYYRLAFGGSGLYLPSHATPVLAVTTRAATTNWSGVPSAASASYGGSAAISGSLGSETGQVAGVAGQVSVQSYNGSSWVAVPGVSATSDSPARYTATIGSLAASGQYRLHFAGTSSYGASDSSAMNVTVSAASATWNPASSVVTVPYGGSAVLTATLSANSAPLSGKTVALYSGGSPVAASIAENPGGSGQYTATLSNVTAGGSYAFYFAGETNHYTSATSTVITVGTTEAKSSWQNEAIDRQTVTINDASPVMTASLKSQTGASIVGVQGALTLQWAADAGFSAPTNLSASVTESATAPGTYQVDLPTGTTGTRYYRLSFAGVSGHYQASASSASALAVDHMPTSWGTTTSVSPTALSQPGGTVVISGVLSDSAANLLTGMAGLVTVKTSTDGSNWTSAGNAVEGPLGTYTGTVTNVPSDIYVELVFAGDATYAPSTFEYPQAITVGRPPAFVGENGVPGVVSYNAGVTLGGTLEDAVGSPLTGKAVVLQRSWDGANWTVLASATEDSPGHYSASANVSERAYYRLYYDGTPDLSGVGVAHLVTPYAYMGGLSSPSRVSHLSYFYVYGSVARAHETRAVTIRMYHKERVRTRVRVRVWSSTRHAYVYVYRYKYVTKWVYRGYVRTYVGAGSGTTPYHVRTRLSRTGSWYMYASVSDAYSLATASGKRYLTSR